jgi:hypothetical protein
MLIRASRQQNVGFLRAWLSDEAVYPRSQEKPSRKP